MLQSTVAVGHNLVPGSLSFDETGNTAWAATTNGSIVTVRLLDRRIELLGSGYRRPVAVIPGHDGLTVSVVERSGRVWRARRDQASRAFAQLVTDLPGRALAARRHPDAARILVLTATAGDTEMSSINLNDGTTTTIASGLTHAVTFTVDTGRRELVVLSIDLDDVRQLTIVGLDDGAISPGPAFDTAFDAVLNAPDGQRAIIGAFQDDVSPGQISFLDLDGNTGSMFDVGRPVESMERWGSLLLLVSGADLITLEWELAAGELPLEVPFGPLYINGYARLRADLGSMGLSIKDVKFEVREGLDAGLFSAGIEPLADDGTQPVVLVAGFFRGEYRIVVTRRDNGDLLAQRRFRVTACWPDDIVGPPVAVTGKNVPWALMSWGGTGAGPGYFLPAPSSIRVAVFLVATKDRRWDGLEAAAANTWKDHVTNTARRFYEEASYRNTPGGPGASPGTTVELLGNRVIGPIDMEEGWGDLFEPKKGSDLERGWLTKQTGRDAMGAAISRFMFDQADGATILEQADAIVIIVRSATDGPSPMGSAPPIPTRYAWGHANSATFSRKNGTTFTQGPRRVTIMTDAYPAGLTLKPILERTLCHELGHNIGLDDLYDAKGEFTDEINARRPQYADLMSTSVTLPHFSIPNSMRLGWIKKEWVRRFDFSASPTGGNVTLHAAGALTRNGPPAGRFAAIEVPIEDGWSYFFELRRKHAGQIGDQQINNLSASEFLILGTDLRVSRGESARPPILFLPIDVEGDGPILDVNGEDYKDSDTTNPSRMHDFVLRLQTTSSPDADSAQIRVDYVAAHRPQLQINPAPGRGNFKSPDIDLLGPFGAVIPGAVKGAPNTLKITVHNRGSLQATQVQVHVKWLPFTLSAGSWISLPDPSPFTVPALGSTSFAMKWDIPASVKVGEVEAKHFCVRVDIDRYRDPAHPEQEEIVVFDNWAQSNFEAVAVPNGSPSDRIRTVATATNALAREATYLFTAESERDGYRIYVGNAWLRLPSGDTRAMELAYENLSDDPLHGAAFAQHREELNARPNHTSVTSWLVPESTECDTPREWWGVSLDMRSGRRTWFEDMRRNGELVTARVLASQDDQKIDVTFGEVHLAAWPADRPYRVSLTEGLIRNDGEARVLLSNETLAEIAAQSRIIAVLARKPDAEFATAVSEPVRIA
jgi:hypothetical protein